MTMNTVAHQWMDATKQSEQNHQGERATEIDKRHQGQDDYSHQLDEQIEEKRRLVALTKTKEKYGDGYNADGEFQTDYRQQEYDRQGRRLEDQNDENRKVVSARKLKNSQGDAYEALVHKMELKAKEGADDKLERKQRQLDDPTDLVNSAQVLEDETEVLSERDKRHQRQDDYSHQLDEQIVEKRRLVALSKTREKYGDGYNADGEFQAGYRQQEYDRQGRRLEDQNDENRKVVSDRKLKSDQGDALVKQEVDDKLERKQRQSDDSTDDGAAQVLEEETEVLSERDKRHQRQDDYSHQLDDQIEEKRRLVLVEKVREEKEDALNAIRF